MRVFKRHLHGERPEKRYCSAGARAFFVRHGLDWSDFLRNGIEEEHFLNTGDAMAIRAVMNARAEEAAK